MACFNFTDANALELCLCRLSHFARVDSDFTTNSINADPICIPGHLCATWE